MFLRSSTETDNPGSKRPFRSQHWVAVKFIHSNAVNWVKISVETQHVSTGEGENRFDILIAVMSWSRVRIFVFQVHVFSDQACRKRNSSIWIDHLDRSKNCFGISQVQIVYYEIVNQFVEQPWSTDFHRAFGFEVEGQNQVSHSK